MSISFSSIPQKRLLQGITSSDSSFYVNNILSFDGENDVAPSDLGSQHFVCFRNDTGTVVEFMEIDPSTISSGPITITRRGLSFYGDLTTENTDLKLDWPANSIVMFGTDVPQIFQWLKEYIDAAAIAGGVPMTEAVQGIAKLNKAADNAAEPYVIGANDIVSYAADSVGSDSYAITPSPAITAYAAGQMFRFKAGTANTGACTLNVNGLGAKTLKKNVTTDLASNDIAADQIVTCIYDGTNMQVISFGQPTEVQIFESDSTWTKPNGAKMVEVICIGAGGGGGGGYHDTGTAYGGCGGGGGAFNKNIFHPDSLGATETVTVGVGGTGGVGDTSGNPTSSATDGTASSFGSHIQAGGGGKGGNGRDDTDGKGGGGGGILTSAIADAAGSPAATADTQAIAEQAASGDDNSTPSTIYGGAAGGEEREDGGSSIYGGCGGAGGGYASVTASDGGEGGSNNTLTIGGGGVAGTTPGGDGGDGDTYAVTGKFVGTGGGGGGGTNRTDAVEAGDGGNGGTGCGGGGGGASADATYKAGDGGDGGDGLVVVITHF
jgi:hypothetical protein